MSVRVGVDIGGTFTDVALEHAGGLATCKVLTDYAEPEAAILEGIRIAAGRAGVALIGDFAGDPRDDARDQRAHRAAGGADGLRHDGRASGT